MVDPVGEARGWRLDHDSLRLDCPPVCANPLSQSPKPSRPLGATLQATLIAPGLSSVLRGAPYLSHIESPWLDLSSIAIGPDQNLSTRGQSIPSHMAMEPVGSISHVTLLDLSSPTLPQTTDWQSCVRPRT